MTVTNKNNGRSINADARKVVDAIEDNPEWGLFYWNVASQYNGTRKELDRRILIDSERRGYNGIKILNSLSVAFEGYKAESDKLKGREYTGEDKFDFEKTISDEEVERIFGSTVAKEDLADNEISGGLKKLKKLGGQVGLGHLLSREEQVRKGLVDEGRLDRDFERKSEAVLEAFFSE